MTAALKRFLKGPIQPQVSSASGRVPVEAEQWLADFDAATLEALRERVVDGTCVWVWPDQRLSAFRTSADQSISAVRGIHQKLRQQATTRNVVWCLENRDELGINAVEAEALLGADLHLHVLGETRTAARLTKVLAAGELREDTIALCIRITCAHDAGASAATMVLSWLTKQAPVAPTIFVDGVTAHRLSEHREAPLASAIIEAVAERGARLALWVTGGHSGAEFAPINRACEQLLAFAGQPVEVIAFADRSAIDEPSAVWPELARVGLRLDATLEGGARSAQNGYFRGGAYFPQPFDLSTPAAVPRDDVPIEVVRLDARDASAWRRRWNDRSATLASLLDLERVVEFDRRMAADPRAAQQYHKFRVYNWPAPDPSPRLTLVDLGDASDGFGVMRALHRCTRAVRTGGFRFVSPAELALAAEHEARQRLPASTRAALDDQRQRHEYLRQERGAPLRADAAAFADFIPSRLGRALEIGVGYGDLARALAPRASKYVGVDLELAGVRDAIVEHGAGAIADIHQLPFRDRTFHAVIANNVLEHAFDPPRALHEIARVLEQGGRLYALVPADARNPDFQLRAHHWKVSAAHLERALRSGGLALQRCVEIDLYKLGIAGSFPSCDGIGLAFEASPF